MEVSAYDIAQRFVGLKEVPGTATNPQILAMLRLDAIWPSEDAVPWCSAFANYIAWLLRLPRSKSLRARSWLGVGRPIPLIEAKPGNDVLIMRQKISDPGVDVIEHPGHVGFFGGHDGARLLILGGNQNDSVNLSYWDDRLILGVRRLA